ncbi:MAG TPA: TolC family protein [Bacteroidales bacterium]
MKMKKILFVISVIACLFTNNSQAQKSWTLEECIRYALDNNIQIKRQELQSETMRNNYQQSKFQTLPNLNAGAGHNWNLGRSVDRYTNEITNTTVMSDNFYIQSSVTLFSGFQTINTIQQNKYILEKSLQDYEKAKNDISLQIATAFLQILFSEEALNIAQNQLDVTSLQLEKTQRLVEVGSKAKGDLLQIQAQQANEKYNVVNAKNNLKIANLTLAQLLELKTADDFKISRPDSVKIEYSNVLATVDDIYKEAESKLPQIKSAEYDQRSNEYGLAVARGQRYPKITMTGSYGTGYSDARQKTIGLTPSRTTVGYVNGDANLPVYYDALVPESGNYPFAEQLKDNASKSLSFSLSVPIFNNFQTNYYISNSKIKVKDSEYNLEQSKKGLYADIQKAHADALAALERYNSANEAVVSNEESFKYTQQKYDVGLVSSVDYNVAKNDLTKAKSDLIQAKYEYIFKIKVLDFYRGQPITLK